MPYPFSLLPVLSASLLPRLTCLSLALLPSSPKPFHPALVTIPTQASRYLPPAHAVACLSRDQSFLQHSHRNELDHAIAQWRSQHRDNPCSTTALHSLREIFPNDSTGGLAVLRSCLPQLSPSSRIPNSSVLGSMGPSTTSISPPPRQCPVPGTWSADEVLSAARWIFRNPGLDWSPTPGAGGHKQIRIKFAIINHWNSGVVGVQGRDAHLVSENLVSTRHPSTHDASVPESDWLPINRRRERFSPSPDSRLSSTARRTPPAPPPSAPSPHCNPHDLSRFSVLSRHISDLPDPAPLSSPPLPFDTSPLRRSTDSHPVPPLSPGTCTRSHSPTCSPILERGSAVGSLFIIFISLVHVFVSWLSSVTVLALSLICVRAFAICPFARKSRFVSRSRCRGYSSQLARRRGAGGRSLCMDSIGHRPPVRLLWKRSPFWVCRLACMGLCYFAVSHFMFSMSWLLRYFQLFSVLSTQPVRELSS